MMLSQDRHKGGTVTDPDIAAVREGLTRVEIAPDGLPSIIVGAIDEPAAALARVEARLMYGHNDTDIAAVREWMRFNHHQLDEELGSSQPTTARYNEAVAALARVEARLAETEARLEAAEELNEVAWGVIAYVSEGNWGAQTDEWQEAAVRWREDWHDSLDRRALAGKDAEG